MNKSEKNESVPVVRKKKKRSGKNVPCGIKIVFFVIAFLIVAALILLIMFTAMRRSGKNKLYSGGTH